ncbi:DNA polymerase subunit Cdc27 [Annulohypoxylon maeteangense]|uniref:DNA polymerase subunit Cdc27 n=1 Tax=Annulohypoxylon maeteangense TaxID=1927788 RepID=UPI002007DEE8|nr:DNA polymerase subunit Cdc27 [Annulohypoxylon maeteangense]KAI0889525.1 DNA polymerase subunit Cdc27 [Annulohypoxylon maeteangense]
MDDYKQYLAQKILTEDHIISYRLLSRSLKVHVNTAKEMLYEFHKWQNDKRPGSLHATYLVYGSKKLEKAEEQDGDVKMTDSQNSEVPHVPFLDDTPTYTLSLVKEEQLQDVLAEYDKVTSIHIYSLAQHPLKDLQLLADTGRQVIELSTVGDVPATSKDFGSIANPNTHRRERRRPVSKPVASAPAAKVESTQELKLPIDKEEPKAAPQASAKGPAASTTKKSAAASLKRQGSSGGIGQMFAKAAARPKKPVTKPAAEDDQKTAMSDDGEDDTGPMPGAKDESGSARQSRINRQAELRRMMEESDEEEPEKPESPADEPMEEEPPEPEPEPEPKAEEPAEIVSSTGDGRRRGRRRVTKKKQVMDDKGYLVTIQEQGWESFSEEEKAPPPSAKPKAQPIKSETATKSKKVAGKGQGNIMSFFSKK